MKIIEIVERIEKSPEFKEWIGKNKNSYFSYALCVVEKDLTGDWQIGYYNNDTDKITTFIANDTINITPEEEVFKKKTMKVKKIDTEKVKIGFEDMMLKSKDFEKKTYPHEHTFKRIIILQNIEKFGTIWNITCLTQTFNTLNMKIDAEKGKVLDHNLSSIFFFQQNLMRKK